MIAHYISISVKELWKDGEGGLSVWRCQAQQQAESRGMGEAPGHMVRNPQGPTLQRIEQTNESAARKQVAVRPCPDTNSEQICNGKKMQAENNHVWMQKSKAGEGQVVRWSGA